MSDNFGVLGEVSGTTVSTHTAYTCPANKAAKVRLMGIWQAAANSDVGVLVNGVEVARTGAMTATHYVFTNGGAGLLSTPGASKPDGTTAGKTVQPADPIYYLSAGDTIQYTVTTTALTAGNLQVVGTEIDLTA